MVIPSNQSTSEMGDNKKNNKTVNKGRGKKRFYWDLVLNNYTEKDCESVKAVFENIGDSYIAAKEIGESGTPHLQMMIKLTKGNYKSFILNKFKETCINNRISIREGRNIDAMKNYCLKDGDILIKHNIENITSAKHNSKEIYEKHVNHFMRHNEKLNKFQIEYIGEHINDKGILPIWIEQYHCTHCKNERENIG